jgi:hypothetical protein
MAEVMKVIPKTYDLLAWMLPVVSKFPRDQKYLLGDRMQFGLMDIMGTLIEANYARDRGVRGRSGGAYGCSDHLPAGLRPNSEGLRRLGGVVPKVGGGQ